MRTEQEYQNVFSSTLEQYGFDSSEYGDYLITHKHDDLNVMSESEQTELIVQMAIDVIISNIENALESEHVFSMFNENTGSGIAFYLIDKHWYMITCTAGNKNVMICPKYSEIIPYIKTFINEEFIFKKICYSEEFTKIVNALTTGREMTE